MQAIYDFVLNSPFIIGVLGAISVALMYAVFRILKQLSAKFTAWTKTTKNTFDDELALALSQLLETTEEDAIRLVKEQIAEAKKKK